MIDHVILPVRDVQGSRKFYEAALKPLGYTVTMEFGEQGVGFGIEGKPDFWISRTNHKPHPVHVGFTAESRDAVTSFHAAALAAGGKDNGQPGVRPHYHPNYFGAFALDPDGHNIEAVCHKPVD